MLALEMPRASDHFFSCIQFKKLFCMHYALFPLHSLSDTFSRTPYFPHFLHGQTEPQKSYSLIVTWFVIRRADEQIWYYANSSTCKTTWPPHWPLPQSLKQRSLKIRFSNSAHTVAILILPCSHGDNSCLALTAGT